MNIVHMTRSPLIFLVLFSISFLSGCANLGDIKSRSPYFEGEIKGNYSRVARCVIDNMQRDSRWTISSLQYNVIVYPDIETSEIQSYVDTGITGVIYGFVLTLEQINEETLWAVLKGKKYESKVALENLIMCTKK